MANHVNTYIRFSGLTPVTVERLKERFEPIEFGTSVGAFFPNVEYTHDFFFENIGSKWCTLEDCLTCTIDATIENFVLKSKVRHMSILLFSDELFECIHNRRLPPFFVV